MLTELLAEYFVYNCGGREDYVTLMDQLRKAYKRSLIIKSITNLIDNKTEFTKKCLSQNNLNRLFRFIQEGNSKEVIIFHRMLTVCISRHELKRIQEQEQYLIELLSCTPLPESEVKRGKFK